MQRWFKILQLVWLLLGANSLQAQTLNQHYSKLLENMYRKTVPLVTVSEAVKWQKTQPSLIFLDTREPEEFAISHIKGAKWVGYNDFNLNRLTGIDKQTPVIVYCSVGYRSEKIGEKLLKAGYTNVHNLYGSIFEWVNQGNPVYKYTDTPTTEVHTYSKSWGKWLQKGKKVY